MIFWGFGQEDLRPPRNNRFFVKHQLWRINDHLNPQKSRGNMTLTVCLNKSLPILQVFTNSYREKLCTSLKTNILTQQMKLGFRWFPFQNRWSSAVKFPGCKSIGIKTLLSTPRTSTRSLVLRPLPLLWNCEASLGSTSTVERVVMDFFESSHRILGVYLPIHKWLNGWCSR